VLKFYFGSIISICSIPKKRERSESLTNGPDPGGPKTCDPQHCRKVANFATDFHTRYHKINVKIPTVEIGSAFKGEKNSKLDRLSFFVTSR
jgi:hypothetical protein